MQSARQDESLLTDLCAICHVNPLKYTCPRCGIHTCSLPCVKRHKQWAQCSGIRDPAEYRKRADLATPSSIDKDYNFITKVERHLQAADDTILDKGISLVPARFRPRDAKSKIDLEIEQRAINIIRAPKGLSREKQNKTCWDGHAKCLSWTVEWILEDGTKSLSRENETKSVRDSYTHAFCKPSKNLKRKRENTSSGSSQHRDGSVKRIQASGVIASLTTQVGGIDPKAAQVQGIVTDSQEESNPTRTNAPDEERSFKSPQATAEASNNPTDTETQKRNTVATESSRPRPEPATEDSGLPRVYFYLHRPDTAAKYKCLIPLQETQTLRQALQGRTIVEFPTIYVLTDPSQQLKQPFISEDEYVRRHGDDIPINVSAPLATETMTISHDDFEHKQTLPLGLDVAESTLNETKILEVLAKDLGN